MSKQPKYYVHEGGYQREPCPCALCELHRAARIGRAVQATAVGVDGVSLLGTTYFNANEYHRALIEEVPQ